VELESIDTRIYNAKVNELYNHDIGMDLSSSMRKDKQKVFERSIRGKSNGSNGRYLMLGGKVSYTLLKLYVYDLRKTIIIDIREFLKEKYHGKRLTKRFLVKVRANMPKEINVQCINSIWGIVDYDSLQFTTLN